MINLKKELKSFLPINLDNILKMGNEISEDIKNSILLYNNALENLKMDSEDIAMIELRKAISLNPEFYEAINLLGICYYYLKDYDKAEEMFAKVAKAEKNGVRAFNYLKSIRKEENPDISQGIGQVKKSHASRKKASRSREVVTREINTRERRPDAVRLNVFPSTGKGKTDRKQEFIKYLTGIIIGLIIAFLIGIPGISKQNKDGNIGNEGTSKDPVVTENGENAEYEEKYKQLSSEHEKLKKDYEIAITDRDYYEAIIKLYDADDLYKAQKYEDAADMLVLVKSIEFKGDEKGKYDKLANEVMPRASDIVYSQAYNLFQGQKFKEAVNKYLKITEYYENFGKMDIVLYYAGKCYLELNDNEKAKEMFLKTIEKYPDSEYAKYSQSRLNSITGNSESE
ncbi:MAG TPA: tetratricopeptide repeat protein [Clostridiaceae bacterium]|nr:tetratricopeptide repeat protein [Clostridiaceae bacterium]